MRERTQAFDPRQTMRRTDFEIFHYENRELPNVAVHHHDFYEVYFFLGGSVEYRVEGQIFRLQPGDLLLINPMELHQVNVEADGQPYERIVLWIDKNYLAEISRGGDDLGRCFDGTRQNHVNLLHPSAAQREELTQMMDMLIRERSETQFGSAQYAQGLFLQLMAQLNRMALRTERSVRAVAESALIAKVLQYIAQHFAEELLLDDLASRFYVSKYHLAHEFSRQVGISLHRYLTMKRLQIARQMIGEGQSPGEACSRCGFGDYASFYRAFRAQYGASPKAYAAQERNA